MKYISLALILLLSLALSACGWNPFHQMYSATAEIQLRPIGVTDMPSPADSANAQVIFDYQIKDMQSDDALTAIIQILKLDQIWAKRFKSDHDTLTPQEALDHLHKVLKIEVLPQTNLINITANSEVPQEAADIANAVANHYKAMRDREETERNQRALVALRNEITRQQKVVDDAKVAVEKHRQNLGYTGPTLPNQRMDPLIPFRDAQRQLEQQQALLDALNVRLKQDIADAAMEESPVRIISRAVPPPE